MFDKWMQYSYAAQKHQRHRYIRSLFVFFILFLLYNALSAFFVSVWTLKNDTMQPGFAAGDRLIFTSFFMPSKENQLPFKRGSVVLVDMGNIKNRKVPLKIIDIVVRFFTAQKHSIFPREEQYYIKRVIALPGDEIYMNNFVFRVKSAGSQYSLTEFELAQNPYHPSIPNVPALWDETIPFSGSMDTIILGPDECFVVSDDRSNTNDSRTWGPVSPSLITAKALLRFWPIKKFEMF
jgi:signal peptidase I